MDSRLSLGHTPPRWVPSGSWFFVTVCCAERGRNLLCRPDVGFVLLESVRAYHCRHQWALHLFLLMPDPWHAILGFPVGVEMATAIGSWKRGAARLHGIRWQRNFFDHRIRPGESIHEKSEYVRHNPVRAGLTDTPETWPYSIDGRAVEGR